MVAAIDAPVGNNPEGFMGVVAYKNAGNTNNAICSEAEKSVYNICAQLWLGKSQALLEEFDFLI